MKAVLRPLELLFRHGIVYPILKLLFRNKETTAAISLQSVQKLLILRYDRIGDIIVTTPVFRRLKILHPHLMLGVLASPSNAELIRNNPCVDKIHVLPNRWWQLPGFISETRREQYDVVLNFIFNRTTSGGVLANLIAPRGIKVGQGAEKYRFYFNRLVRLERGQDHMSAVLMKYADTVFGLKGLKIPSSFEIVLGDAEKRAVTSFLTETGLKRGSYVVLNISAAEKERKVSREQAFSLAHALSARCGEFVVVISSPADEGMRREIVSSSGARVYAFPPQGNTDMLTIAALIGESNAVITPDTSIIHVASAMETPVMGLYTPLRVTNEWLPYRVLHRIVLAPPNKPVTAITTEMIESEVKSFLMSLKSKRRPRKSASGKNSSRK